MCCFTGHVSDVSGTNIFARVNADREHLVYEMTFSSDEDTAMILPIPIASGPFVRFVRVRRLQVTTGSTRERPP